METIEKAAGSQRENRTWVYLRSILLSILFIWIPATIQHLYVYGKLSPKLYLLPTLAGTVFGILLARLSLMRSRLAAQRALFQGITDAASICSWLHDASGRLAYVSAASHTVLGIQAEILEAQPERLPALLTEKDSDDYPQRVQTLLQQFGSDEYLLNLRTVTGVEKRVRVHLESLLDGEGRIVGVLGQAETARMELADSADLHRSLRQDESTGLGNRSQLLEDLTILSENSSRQHSLFVVYLEGLVRIRSLYGQEYAEQFLQTWVKELKQTQGSLFRLYRLGRNRMALLLEDSNPEQASSWIEPLSERMAVPVQVGEVWLSVQVCMGIAAFPQDASTPLAWLDNAELAARAAKENHAPWGLYTPVLRKVHEGDERKEKRLIQAIEKGEIHAWVQPIYKLPELRQTGVELQGFWRPDGVHWRALSLDWSFLERFGLARKAERLLLQQALSALRRMEDAGIVLRCGFNLPVAALLDRKLESFLKEQMDQAGLPPERLVLEIADVDMHAMGELEEITLHHLADSGFTLALDHFGAGLSSLSLLKCLPLKVVKLDQPLLRQLSVEEQEIWDRVVVLGKQRGLDMLLAGVESQEEYEQACAIGVDFIQGPFLHELIALKDFENRVARKGLAALQPH